MGKDRLEDATTLLGDALIKRPGARNNTVLHYLDGQALSQEILEEIPVNQRPAVKATQPQEAT